MMNRIRGIVLIVCGLGLLGMLIMLSGADGRITSGKVMAVLLGGAGIWTATFAAGALYAFVPPPFPGTAIRIARALIIAGLLVSVGYLVSSGPLGAPGLAIIGVQALVVIPMYFRLPRLG